MVNPSGQIVGKALNPSHPERAFPFFQMAIIAGNLIIEVQAPCTDIGCRDLVPVGC
jgi:hypothetical protein